MDNKTPQITPAEASAAMLAVLTALITELKANGLIDAERFTSTLTQLSSKSASDFPGQSAIIDYFIKMAGVPHPHDKGGKVK